MLKLCITFLIFAGMADLSAQLSPGDLANAHKNLEGLENCTKCHEIGKKVLPEKCLDCHKPLRERINANKGLHAQAAYRNCVDCHADHHGRDYQLIWWKDGQKNLDHRQTGYQLEGKHNQVECRQCHQSKNITNIERLKSRGKDLNKTFLGLQGDCLNCHRDEHRGQLDKNCLKCHQMTGWKPVANFDHNNSKFILTGKHQRVPCVSCHKNTADQSKKSDNHFTKYTGLSYKNCTPCHHDPHRGRLGADCTSCHGTSGWQGVSSKRFDHEKTRFPLLGKHNSVPCAKCHKQGRSVQNLKFKFCRDCHQDYHQGQFINRPQKGACEDCHTVEGFTPANFTVQEHNQTGYPLQEAHLAVPCMMCHQKTFNHTERYDFPDKSCVFCHHDPHQGTALQYVRQEKKQNQADYCIYCHSMQSWRQIDFDHGPTGFRLEGKHQTAKCGACHKETDKTRMVDKVNFKIKNKLCQDCHKDVHSGQFADRQASSGAAGVTHCERCHTPADWSASGFNHNRDSRFKLEGAHLKVSCVMCHKQKTNGSEGSPIYKPLDTACSACHGSLPVDLQGKKL